MHPPEFNAGPDPAFEAGLEDEPFPGTAAYREKHGDYVETLFASPRGVSQVLGHGIAIVGGFTRFRGAFDIFEYGVCIVDGRDYSDADLRPAHFMVH